MQTLETSIMAAVVAANTDMTNAAKTQRFREAVNQFLTESASNCFAGEAEQWFAKDVVQLLCEVSDAQGGVGTGSACVVVTRMSA